MHPKTYAELEDLRKRYLRSIEQTQAHIADAAPKEIWKQINEERQQVVDDITELLAQAVVPAWTTYRDDSPPADPGDFGDHDPLGTY